jgi:hypothetical protein
MKTYEEALTQWVSDEIEFLVGKCRSTYTREAFTKIVDAINRGDAECKFDNRNCTTLLTHRNWGELRAALLLRNEVLTTAFLCRFDSFLEAAFAINPPDTLAFVNKKAAGWYGPPTSALNA